MTEVVYNLKESSKKKRRRKKPKQNRWLRKYCDLKKTGGLSNFSTVKKQKNKTRKNGNQ